MKLKYILSTLLIAMGGSFGDFMQLSIVLKLIVGDSKLFIVHLGGIAGYHWSEIYFSCV
jgi:hypothetical protein